MFHSSLLRYAGVAVLSTFLLGSCTTTKKYNSLLAQKVKLEREKADCQSALSKTRKESSDLSKQVADLTEYRSQLAADTTLLGGTLRKTQALYADLSSTYDKLIKNHDRLMANSALESSKLSKDLSRRDEELNKLNETLTKNRSQLDQLSKDLKTREERLNELERILAEKDKAVNALRTKVSNALLGFNSKDLSVNVRNGKVYVSLSEQLLFKSGSTKVDVKGQDALRKLAAALKDQQDVNVLVEGHTDDVPVSKGTAGMQDNWDLSVLRATEITRILTNAGLAGTKITPSGRAENAPLDAAKTADARQKNRRTEIILTPKLDELFQILEAN
ncbi:OmpA family protein [Rufibacter latericius]|uniref:Cell envelope biogenesis protein OmpA n=1 Tax=Rufibacter latericius TaxID=2487040 RepID=A0A3M9N0P4_9BACT|nr:OmpA family protein [Rufibacter latericius]RNI31364.1 cell envelope biogenesis protein OmpA [Rufibacter latericius]